MYSNARTRSPDTRPAKKPNRRPRTPCSRCYTNAYDYNGEESCFRCLRQGKKNRYRRVMCRNFEVGQCKHKKCTFAHEEDGYKGLIPYMKWKKRKQEQAKDDWQVDAEIGAMLKEDIAKGKSDEGDQSDYGAVRA